MNWKEIVTEPEERRVFAALDEPDCSWRSADAVAFDTELSVERIMQIVQKYEGNLTRRSVDCSISRAPLVGLIEKTPLNVPNPHVAQIEADIAAAVSQATDRILDDISKRIRRQDGQPDIPSKQETDQ